ncbi:hypothetical protein OIV83_000600 [Microbotryomycetes sp. JL201]|nr:hypothetical protein OIV83_000600 [Microbotryomycetes sp. JL201]
MSEPLTSQSGSDSDEHAPVAPTPPSRGTKIRGGRARGTRGGRGRGRGRGRGAAQVSAREVSAANGASSDDGSDSPSRRSASPELAAPPSPELAAPSLHDNPPARYSRSKSSSLSEHSSRQSSPGTVPDETVAQNNSTGPAESKRQANAGQTIRARTTSVSSALSALSELKEDSVSSDTENPATAPPLAKEGTVTIKQEATEAEHDSESVLSDTDQPDSTTASASKRQPGKQPRGRGRPRGAKRGFPGGARGGRQSASSTAANAATSASAVNRSPVSSQGTASIVPARATRANVTLPPGYIEGVTGSRWPRVSNKHAVTDSEDRSEDESRARDDEREAADPAANELSNDEDVPLSNIVVEPPTDAETDAGSEMTPRITPKDTPKSSRANSPLTDLTPEPVTDSDRPTATSGRGGRGGWGGRGRKGRKGMTKAEKALRDKEQKEKEKREQDNSNRAERLMSKRRKMEHLTVEQVEARNAARSRYLKDLDKQEEAIQEGTHPLIGQAKAMLDRERIFRLSNLAKIMARREHEFEQLYEAAVQQEWRQWEEQKDSTRMEMYLENHFAMRRLLNEEKAYPFLCDHPLLSNSYGVPLAPYYRAPVLESDSTYVPRTIIHAGHYLEPPPLNSALDHSVWKLPAGEIESDLALLRDFDGDYVPPPPLPPRTVMPLYGYPSPDVLFQAGYQPGPYDAAPQTHPYFDPTASAAGAGAHNHAAPFPSYHAPPSAPLNQTSANSGQHAPSPYQHMAFPAVHPPRPNYDSSFAPLPFNASYPSASSTSSSINRSAGNGNGSAHAQSNGYWPGHGINGGDTNAAGASSKTRRIGKEALATDHRKPYWAFG